MRRTSYAAMNCSIAAALEIIGEPWTLLILRDAMYGVRRFDEFQANLGIARNVLTLRLRRLVEAGIFRRVPYQQRPTRYEYRLSDKGAALFPVIVGLKEWGDRFRPGNAEGKPMELVDRTDSLPVEPLLTDARSGRRLELTSVRAVAGSGASESTRTFFARIEYARSRQRRTPR
jgi:DNA-binding HxlR family transcriptional regulator